ncbi:hypothetical protein PMIN03_012137 [Paraphaeosphaeria minitans]
MQHETADRGSTTEPDTPDSQKESPFPDRYIFARLIATNRPARLAIQRTFEQGSSYHKSFIGRTTFRNEEALCFEISLERLPEFPRIGWRIGKGRDNLPNRGVDFLLSDTDGHDDVAGIHARLGWIRGMAGFFLTADNKRGKRCTINGDDFANDRRSIPFRSTITLGECAFTLQYVIRDTEQENQFQIELKAFYKLALGDGNPFIPPTPRDADARFGDWVVQFPISKGTFGTVSTVTNAKTGQVAAAKQLVMTRRNARSVQNEIAMAQRISKMSYPNIASPFHIRHNQCRTKTEITRIRALLGEAWDPETQGDITEEWIIFSPLEIATLQSLVTSTDPIPKLVVFFLKCLSGVAFLHEHGLCHRDIKPVNILIRSYDPPEAVLCDFGSVSDKSEMDYDWPGTLPYLAPEQRPGLRHGPTVDYWASGLVGYELLTQENVKGRVEDEAMLDDFHGRLDRIGSEMAKCCKLMLAMDPTLRMPAADVVATLSAAVTREERKEEHFKQDLALTSSSKRVKVGGQIRGSDDAR